MSLWLSYYYPPAQTVILLRTNVFHKCICWAIKHQLGKYHPPSGVATVDCWLGTKKRGTQTKWAKGSHYLIAMRMFHIVASHDSRNGPGLDNIYSLLRPFTSLLRPLEGRRSSSLAKDEGTQLSASSEESSSGAVYVRPLSASGWIIKICFINKVFQIDFVFNSRTTHYQHLHEVTEEFRPRKQQSGNLNPNIYRFTQIFLTHMFIVVASFKYSATSSLQFFRVFRS